MPWRRTDGNGKTMSNKISVTIDVTLIDKALLVPGKKKNRQDKMPQYLKLFLIPSKQSNFGDSRDENTHMVVQDLPRDKREAGERGEILGNAKEWGFRPKAGVSDAPTPTDKPAPPDGDDVPF